ncbi:MAG: bifunctional phosphoglucose/phosphomannose isomerase [Candidatus Aenigmarchaeota archaeon]|nr:bifunctional phosphoglucose/phosphomannose isomerase [Candidatus Aenigmarchaeota archaeon]
MEFTKLIEKYDRSDMLSLIRGIPDHILDAADIARGFDFEMERPENIVIAGMGGSGVGGSFLVDMLKDRLDIPIFVHNGYSLPKFAGKKTLLFAVSYSGNTEETISAYQEAEKRGTTIVPIASGGRLGEMAKDFVKIPAGNAPRTMLVYTFVPMVVILEKIGLIGDEVDGVYQNIRDHMGEFEERGKELAGELKDTLPVIFSSAPFGTVSYRWNTQLSENSKVLSVYGQIPEMNHNTINVEPDEAEISFVFLRYGDEPDRIKQRIEISKRTFENYGKVIEVNGLGGSYLDTMLSLTIIGDFTSYYLALLREKDPTEMENIENLKKELA